MKKIQPNPDTLKIGDTYWECFAWADDSCHVPLDPWVVRTIRSPNVGKHSRLATAHKRVYLIQKNEYTWIKDGSVWRWASNIAEDHRRSFILGKELPYRIYTTRLQAARASLTWVVKRTQALKKWIADNEESWNQQELQEEQDCYDMQIKLITQIKRRITMERNKGQG